MSAQLTVLVADVERQVDAGTTAADLFPRQPQGVPVVVARVNGELKDLAYELAEGDRVEPVTIDSAEGLAVLRHSAAHVLAQAVQEVFPEAKLGIGPPVRDGFYYDFDVEKPFTPEDLKALDKVMQRIIKEGQTFRRRELSDDEARAELSAEPFKLELIGLKGGAAETAAEGAAAEVGGAQLSIYDNLKRDGSLAWRDLCRGPHLPNTRLIGNGFQLTRSAAAYWRGSEKNPQLQRVYGTAWPTKDDLKAYLDRLADAERRDHRRLGNELDLFSFPDELGSGLAVFHPKGGIDPARDGELLPAPARGGGLRLRLQPAHHQGPPVRDLRPPGLVQGRDVPGHAPGRGARRRGQHPPAGPGLLPQADELPVPRPDLP